MRGIGIAGFLAGFLVCALVWIASASIRSGAVQASNECADPVENLAEAPADLDAALRSHAKELKGRVGRVRVWKGAPPDGDARFIALYSVLGAGGATGNNWDVYLAAYRMAGGPSACSCRNERIPTSRSRARFWGSGRTV